MNLNFEDRKIVLGVASVIAGLFVCATGIDMNRDRLIREDDIRTEIRGKEDKLGEPLGRPPWSDIANARAVLLEIPPKAAYNEDYFGDPVTCRVQLRAILKMHDSACGVLDVAKAKEPELRELKLRDPDITHLVSLLSPDHFSPENIASKSVLAVGLLTMFIGAGVGLRQPVLRKP